MGCDDPADYRTVKELESLDNTICLLCDQILVDPPTAHPTTQVEKELLSRGSGHNNNGRQETTSSDSNKDQLSTGAIDGISVGGSAVVFLFLLGLVYYFLSSKKKSTDGKDEVSRIDSVTPGQPDSSAVANSEGQPSLSGGSVELTPTTTPAGHGLDLALGTTTGRL